MHAQLCTRRADELRAMAAARLPKTKMAAALGVHPATITFALKKLGIEHGGNHWTTRKFKTVPIVTRLREERMNQCLTVDEFARKAGWDRSLIGEWERGARRMHVPALVDLANALGFDVVLVKRAP